MASRSPPSAARCPRAGIAVFVIFLAITMGCGEPAPPPEEARIGLVLPLSWDTGFRTDSIVAAAELAIDEAAARGDFPFAVRLLPADSGGNAEVAVEAIRALVIRERAHAIIGPFLSRTVLRASPLIERLEVPVLTPTATHPEVGAGRRFIFRVARAGAELQGEALAELAIGELEADRAAALFEQTDLYPRRLAEAFAQRFQDLGGRQVALEGYPVGVVGFADRLRRVAETDPGVLLLPNNSSADVKAQAMAARELGLEAVLLGGDTWNELDVSHPALDGGFFVDHWHLTLESPESRRFVDSYRARYSEDPTVAAALTYDAFGALLAAIEKGASLESRTIRQALADLSDLPGATGSLGFSPHPRKPDLYVIRIEDGVTRLLGRVGESLP